MCVLKFKIDIKYESYHNDGEIKWAKEPELSILAMSDIFSETPVSYKFYKNMMGTIMKNPDFVQAEVNGLDLKTLETQKLYVGSFLIEINTETKKMNLVCLNYELARFGQ